MAEKTDGRKTRRVRSPAVKAAPSPRLERENDRLLKERDEFKAKFEKASREIDEVLHENERIREANETAHREIGAVQEQHTRLVNDHRHVQRAVMRLKAEIERLRTERDTYRGALAAKDPEAEVHLSERLNGTGPTLETVYRPMVNRSGTDFEEVDDPHWFDL